MDWSRAQSLAREYRTRGKETGKMIGRRELCRVERTRLAPRIWQTREHEGRVSTVESVCLDRGKTDLVSRGKDKTTSTSTSTAKSATTVNTGLETRKALLLPSLVEGGWAVALCKPLQPVTLGRSTPVTCLFSTLPSRLQDSFVLQRPRME